MSNSKPLNSPAPEHRGKDNKTTDHKANHPAKRRWIPALGWILALIMIALTAYTWWTQRGIQAPQTGILSTAIPSQTASPTKPANQPFSLPELVINQSTALQRLANIQTIIPNRPRADVTSYQVAVGDSVFAIAQYFNIEPETVLWANYDQLNDSPDMLEPGMQLNIPPVNGVYYEWKEGDTLEGVADEFEVEVDDILSFTGNKVDLLDPTFESEQMVMIPGGKREFRQWLIPTIARGNAGVSNLALGPGACRGPYEGAYGSGAFVWPADNHFLSGNDYWSGHLGIDLAAGTGANIYASDAGVIVFAGWAVGGYGNMVMIDHGNGYQTLYAHMSSLAVGCGRSVGPGNIIGYGGSTGNSTGPHLHFEVRLNSGFINPWFVLPAP